jgi:altronate hydrolase
MEKFYRIHPQDNVAVAIEALAAGTILDFAGKKITVKTAIPAGHKIALVDIAKGTNVVKYGFPIGTATTAIAAGDWVHTHNVHSRLGNLLEYTYEPVAAVNKKAAAPALNLPDTFLGYARENGQVGIRNEVWIVPTVGCVNAIACAIERKAQEFIMPGIDGVYAYTHPFGCSQLGDDQGHTQKILSGLVHNPNAGAVLVLGLGCENNQISQMKEIIGTCPEGRVRYLVCQDEQDEIAAGVKLVKELIHYAAHFKRTEQSVAKLVLGLKCGGSDGFSGITANPLLGWVVDKLIAAGGTAILSEVPEMFGAETLLMNRCRDKATFGKTVNLINNFKKYFQSYGEKINENPSPGNKAGGITTLEDKSLGCVQKGGQAIVEDVLSYGQRVQGHGLVLLEAPGNDLVAANAEAAAGAQMVLFTTGRGTPFACPVPTLKISSNSRLAQFKEKWIDFNAGVLLEGHTMEETGAEFYRFILDVASGRQQAKAEKLDKHEIAIFKNGVTL